MITNYYAELIEFFKKHKLYDEKIFNYIEENSFYFYMEDNKLNFKGINIGIYPLIDKNGTLTEIKLCIPYVENYKTLLINIHEYLHAITLYNQIGKKFKSGIDIEILPMLYERIYLSENPNLHLENYIKLLNSQINNDSPPQYKIALKTQEELLEYYQKENPSFKKLQKKAKKLSRKYDSN